RERRDRAHAGEGTSDAVADAEVGERDALDILGADGLRLEALEHDVVLRLEGIRVLRGVVRAVATGLLVEAAALLAARAVVEAATVVATRTIVEAALAAVLATRRTVVATGRAVVEATLPLLTAV